jgi:hypothetical protein
MRDRCESCCAVHERLKPKLCPPVCNRDVCFGSNADTSLVSATGGKRTLRQRSLKSVIVRPSSWADLMRMPLAELRSASERDP